MAVKTASTVFLLAAVQCDLKPVIGLAELRKHSTFSKHVARHSHRKRAEKTLPGCGRLAHTLVPKDSAVAAWNPFSFNDFRETIHAAHSEFIRLPFLSE